MWFLTPKVKLWTWKWAFYVNFNKFFSLLSGHVQGALSTRRRWAEPAQENAQDFQWLARTPERQERPSIQNQNLHLLALRDTGGGRRGGGYGALGTSGHLNLVVRATPPHTHKHLLPATLTPQELHVPHCTCVKLEIKEQVHAEWSWPMGSPFYPHGPPSTPALHLLI